MTKLQILIKFRLFCNPKFSKFMHKRQVICKLAKSRITKLDFVKQHDIHFYQATGANSIVLASSNSNLCSAYKKGMIIYFIANATNTGAINISIDSLPIKNATKFDGTPFVGGEILLGLPYMWIYNGEEFMLLGSEVSEIQGNITDLVNEISSIKTNITTLEENLTTKVGNVEFNELLSRFEITTSELDTKINDVKTNLEELNNTTKTDLLAVIETLKAKIRDAFEQVGVDTTTKINAVEEKLKNNISDSINTVEIKIVLGENFDPTGIEEYQSNTEYTDGTMVKYEGEYAVVYSDEIILTGIKY